MLLRCTDLRREAIYGWPSLGNLDEELARRLATRCERGECEIVDPSQKKKKEQPARMA